jgi:hypothetical protein
MIQHAGFRWNFGPVRATLNAKFWNCNGITGRRDRSFPEIAGRVSEEWRLAKFRAAA